jgi:peptide/nickel transport system permease protein
MKKKNKGFFGTIGGWFKRLFFGGSKTMADEMEENAKNMKVEEIVSPFKQIVRGFFERKLAVFALCVVIAMFLLVFIGPLFMPKYYDSYTEVTQQNVHPTMSMLSVPGDLKDDIRMIDSFGSFTVGVNNSGEVFIWGDSKISTTGLDVRDIPDEVKEAKIVYVAAGIDHVVAISEEGKVYCWGYNKLGQFGYFDPENKDNANILPEPDILLNGTIDVDHIKKVTCGYQCSAILMDDGTLYIWGNKNTYQNIDLFLDRDNFIDIDFTLNYVVGVTEAGNSIYTGKRGLYDQYRSNLNEKAVSAREYLDGRKIVAITATSNTVCGELDDGTLFFTGDFGTRAKPMPALQEGEHVIQIVSGTYHYTALTDKGRVLSWGGDTLDQTQVPKDMTGVTRIYGGAFQSYAVNDNNELVGKWGLKGYLFGTDNRGADIFQRIIQGGKMTMTIGAIAVIISTIIGIIVGCISGYFGGKVDLILMRVTEIFAAIPFLPFALILSAILAQSDISEDNKIFLLMVILGVLTWTGLARMVRGQVLVARENEYVTAAKAMGVKEGAIAFKHILPNIVSIIFVTLTLDFATCMLTESSLSYLGFGVTYPRPTWGNMLNGANNATIITNFWWEWLFTALFLAITCICINIVGDTLRDVMDPKSDRDK